ncbi:hypothetical protein [Synechococcus elongatus]|uniref:hypothetical protein n=1 Tax=Synechococcus elongatus TaxID=32046 RepID=UPI000F7F8C2C|nr:hypothetical protein [Synechococcus elongatus]
MNEPQPIPVTVVDVTPGNTLASVVGLPPARVEQPLPQRQRASLPTNPANLDDYLNALAGMGIVGGGLAFGLSTGLAQRSQSNQNQLPLTGGTMGMM